MLCKLNDRNLMYNRYCIRLFGAGEAKAPWCSKCKLCFLKISMNIKPGILYTVSKVHSLAIIRTRKEGNA